MKLNNCIAEIRLTAVSLLITSFLIFSASSPVHAQEAVATLELGTVTDGVRHVNASEAAKILEHNKNVRVLDVRTGWEYKGGHLKDAVNLNYYSFGFKKALNQLDINAIWLVHCKSGVRSGNTVPLMREAGFEHIIHMDGGIDAWKEAGLPVL